MKDEQLMILFANNDISQGQKAFERLYQRHKGPLYRFIKKSCNNETQCDELFQELWLKIINNKQQFNPQYKFTTWAYTIANRLLIDWFRQNGKNIEDATDHEQKDAELKQPENELERKRMAQHLQKAITQLPAKQRRTFVMKHEADMSLTEVAEATQQPIERIKSQYRYAVNKLKSTLESWR